MASQFTPEEYKRVNDEYDALAKRFKPKVGNSKDIDLSRRMGSVLNHENLMAKHKDNPQKKLAFNRHRKEAYEGKKYLLPSLVHYFNSQSK